MRSPHPTGPGVRSEGVELRAVVDDYLEGIAFRVMGKTYKRTARALFHLIHDKIPSNYTERGKRSPFTERLKGIPSRLDPNREPTYRDRDYLKELLEAGKYDTSGMALILNLPVAVVLNLAQEL